MAPSTMEWNGNAELRSSLKASSNAAILDGEHTPQNVALYAFATGALFGGSLAVAYFSPSIPQLGVFLAALAIFHISEYILTAMFNPEKLGLDGESENRCR
jgi:hypothetical protein